jgi:hypothetical protein
MASRDAVGRPRPIDSIEGAMSGPAATSTRQALTTPRAAAIAGIAFAALFGATVVLIRLALPDDPADDGGWLSASAGSVSLALSLAPFAGIAFLWFMGVVRDHLGPWEDRFFSTVFVGSGLLFLAMFFAAAALAGGLLADAAAVSGRATIGDAYALNRQVMHLVFNTYAIKMAGVFMMSLGTIWVRTGVMPRWLALLTYPLALTLLVSIAFSLWVTLIFPAWVLVISVYILVQNMRGRPDAAERDLMSPTG